MGKEYNITGETESSSVMLLALWHRDIFWMFCAWNFQSCHNRFCDTFFSKLCATILYCSKVQWRICLSY